MSLTPGTVDISLTATNQPLLTANAPLFITKALVCNVGASNRALTFYKVPAGMSANTFNEIWDAVQIAPGTTVPLPFSGLVLGIADSIQGFASATNTPLNVTIGWVIPQ